MVPNKYKRKSENFDLRAECISRRLKLVYICWNNFWQIFVSYPFQN